MHIADMTDEEIDQAIDYPALDEDFRQRLIKFRAERAELTELDRFQQAMKEAKIAVSDYRTDVAECSLQIVFAIRCGDIEHAAWIANRMRDRAEGVEGMLDGVL